MTTETKSSKIRPRHSQQYKTESLTLAEKVGVPTTAKQLGLYERQVYSLRSKVRLSQERRSVEERFLEENARLKRQVAEQAEELGIVKGHSVLRQEPEVKYAFMHNHSDESKITSIRVS